jgi:hypothetical protein
VVQRELTMVELAAAMPMTTAASACTAWIASRKESEEQRPVLTRVAIGEQDVSEPFAQLPLGSRVDGGKTRHGYEAEQFGALFGENAALYEAARQPPAQRLELAGQPLPPAFGPSRPG